MRQPGRRKFLDLLPGLGRRKTALVERPAASPDAAVHADIPPRQPADPYRPISLSRHSIAAHQRPDDVPGFLTGQDDTEPSAAQRRPQTFRPAASAPPPRPAPASQVLPVSLPSTPPKCELPRVSAGPAKPSRARRMTVRMAPVAAVAVGALMMVGYAEMDGGLFGYGDLTGRKPILGKENAIAGAFIVRTGVNGPSYLLEDLALKSVWAPRPFRRMATVGPAGTFEELLTGKGVPVHEATAAAVALKRIFDPARMHVGQSFAINFFPQANGGDRFTGLRIDTGADASITVVRGTDGRFAAKRIDHPVIVDLVRNEAIIDQSLYIAGLHEGVPPAVMIDLIHLLSFDVDFQRDIRRGDVFEAMYERVYDERTGFTRSGDLLYVGLTLAGQGGQKVRYWRYRMKNGQVAYFDERGRGVKKSLMRTPIDGARLTSGFGMRRHPILGYSKMHQGVDFAAPYGTPIYAAGDGVITVAKRKGGYGKYIQIRHHKGYSTAYAHMKGYARGMRPGKRVRQGQVIGYVGSTGRSTGPHLHYEVLQGKRQINPLRMKLPSGNQLKGKDYVKFQQYRRKLMGQLVALEEGRPVVLSARRLKTASVTTDGGQ